MTKNRCHSCGAELAEIPDFRSLRRVTSDCKPITAGGRKGVCVSCHLAQSIIDTDWRTACHNIYSNYTVYYQADGVEQVVFSPGSEIGTARSKKILSGTRGALHLPRFGKALDIGCGNGNFLKAVSKNYPNWRLSGCEYNESYRKDVLSIPAVESFYSGGIDSVDGQYDFISLIHVLEHIENPILFLKKVASLMTASGTLLIQVPYFLDNPFELLIADHASHFEESSISRVLSDAGFDILMSSTRIVLKEITILAKRSKTKVADPEVDNIRSDSFSAAVESILKFRERAMELRRTTDMLAVFGTSIGGTWLSSELDNKLEFFVDEDNNRIGKKHLGKDIIALNNCPEKTALCIPLAPCIADSLILRAPVFKTPPLLL